MMLEVISGMTHIYISCVHIKLYKDVLQKERFPTYGSHIMLQHMNDILVVIEQLVKYCNQVITGQLFLKMLMNLLNVVTGVKGQGT